MGSMPSLVPISTKAVPQMWLLHIYLVEELWGRQDEPCGNIRNAPELSKKESNHSPCGPGILPDPAAAEEQAGNGPQVLRDKRGKWNQPESSVLNRSLK